MVHKARLTCWRCHRNRSEGCRGLMEPGGPCRATVSPGKARQGPGPGRGQKWMGGAISRAGHARVVQSTLSTKYIGPSPLRGLVPQGHLLGSRTQSRCGHPEAAQLTPAELDGVRLPPLHPRLCRWASHLSHHGLGQDLCPAWPTQHICRL